METFIPLDRLVPAPENVRRTGRSEGVPALASSIDAHGLLQPLLVRAAGERFAVVAGRRRLAALKLLARRGRIERDHPVACRHAPEGADAVELSLAENVQRADMHPVDRFEAFAALAARGQAPAGIAARFGLASTTVARLLRLGQLHPDIRAAYRDGRIADHRTACAFALSPDPEEQKRVFDDLVERFDVPLPAWAVRERLTAGRIEASSALGRFVRAAYEAAGHPVERDLFAEEDALWLDRRLAVETAEALLAREAERLRADGWGWVEAGVTLPDGFWRLHRLDPEDGEDFAAEQKAAAGCVVAVGPDGALRVERGLQRPQDRPADPRPAEEAGGETPQSPARPALSAALRRDLEDVRTRVFQAALAASPDWALVLLLERLVAGLFGGPAGAAVCAVTAVRETGGDGEGAACHDAEAQLAAIEDRFRPLARMEPLDRLEAIAALGPSERSALLALCAALTCRAPFDEPDPRIERVGAALGIDVAAAWRPSEAGFWMRVPKAVMAEALTGTGVASVPVASMRKADAASLLAALTARDDGERSRAWPKARAAMRHWLPEGVAFGTDRRPPREPDDDPDPAPTRAPVPEEEAPAEEEPLPAAA